MKIISKNQRRRPKAAEIYFIHEFEISREIIDEFLPDVLKAFPCSTVTDRFKKSLYTLPVSFTVNICRHQHRNSIEKSVSSSSSLYDLLKQFLCTTEQNFRYNFVILADRLIFARIPTMKDLSYFLLTKHISLANQSPDVRFAGEFWSDEFGRWRVNNNSGTYRPSDAQHKRAVELFQHLNPMSSIKPGSRSPVCKRACQQRLLYF